LSKLPAAVTFRDIAVEEAKEAIDVIATFPFENLTRNKRRNRRCDPAAQCVTE